MIAENSRDTAVLEASGPQGHVFIYSLGECVYRISGLYEFSFGQEVPYKPTTYRHISQMKIGNILYRLLASRLF